MHHVPYKYMSEPIASHKTFTVDEVAAYFRVDPATVWRWVKKGYLPAVRIEQGTTRILRTDFLKFIRKYRTRPTTPKDSRAGPKGASIQRKR